MERYIEIIRIANELIIDLATRLEENERILDHQSAMINGLSNSIFLSLVVIIAMTSFIVYIMKRF